jgi:hypothetical protein
MGSDGIDDVRSEEMTDAVLLRVHRVNATLKKLGKVEADGDDLLRLAEMNRKERRAAIAKRRAKPIKRRKKRGGKGGQCLPA